MTGTPRIRRIRAGHPEMFDPRADDDPRRGSRVASAAVQELYNPAQIDVLRRIRELLRDEVGPATRVGTDREQGHDGRDHRRR